jgi:hypothetical protein
VSSLCLCSVFHPRAGYGGALSTYFGLSSGLQLLKVENFQLLLLENAFVHCFVNVDPSVGGNAYGGGVSVYMGGYSSSYHLNGDASAHVGDTSVRNVSLTLRTARFTSCSASRSKGAFGSNSFGGSFSFFLGAYSWSRSGDAGSSSIIGTTIARDLRIDISETPCSNCSAVTASEFDSMAANSYGGSMSVLYIGGYAWSFSNATGSNTSSVCGATTASGLSVSVRDAACFNCSAVTTSGGNSGGANLYGGSMSVVYIGGYAWSFSNATGSNTSSSCGATTASGLSVIVHEAACFNCSALTTSGGSSAGSNSYGGSMSVVYIGGYAWSFSNATGSNTSSSCGATTSSGLSVSVRDTPCYNCSAVTTSVFFSLGANSYGGSMSVVYIGGYAWIFGASTNTSSSCGPTTASGLIVSVIDAACINCSAVTTIVVLSNAANSYGGSMSVVYIGGYAWIFSNTTGSNTSSVCGATTASGLRVSVRDAACLNCSAVTTSGGSRFGGNSYGGSMSVVYIGGYAWSLSVGASSNTSSSCGVTTATDLIVSVRGVTCLNCIAVTTCGRNSHGANSYGGSMSVVYIGGYAWSLIEGAISNTSSSCGATVASGLSVSVIDSPCTNCSAVTTSVGFLNGGNAYGGSMSVLYIVSFSESFSFATSNTVSRCETTNASRLTVSVIGVACSHCIAVTNGLDSNGANSYGGSMSVAHIGGYAWSFSTRDRSNTSSSCGATTASGLIVSVIDAACINCSAVTTSIRFSGRANSYGGSMSVLYIGGYAWSFSNTAGSNTSSSCGATTSSGLSVSVRDTPCYNCSAVTTSRETLFGANSYGGSMSVVYIGGTAWSFSVGDRLRFSLALCQFTHVDGLSVSISQSASQQSKAISRKFSVHVLYFAL